MGVAVMFLVGVALAISGNTLIACSLTLQKHVHNRSDGAAASSSLADLLADGRPSDAVAS